MSDSKTSTKGIAQKKGLYLAGIMVLATLLAYFINWDIFLSPWFQVTKFVLVMLLAILAIAEARKINFKNFTFREGFSTFFITVAIGTFIFVIANWLLFDLIDKSAGHYINDMAIDLRKEQLEAMEKTPEFIEDSIGMLKESYQFSFGNQLKGYFMNLILYCIPAMLVALIFKTKKPIIT